MTIDQVIRKWKERRKLILENSESFRAARMSDASNRCLERVCEIDELLTDLRQLKRKGKKK